MATGHNRLDVEQYVIDAMEAALRHPEIIREALAAYEQAVDTPSNTAGADRLRKIEGELKKLAQEEASAIKAQIAGITAEAAAEAYAAVFADIASRRIVLQTEHGRIKQTLARPEQEEPNTIKREQIDAGIDDVGSRRS